MNTQKNSEGTMPDKIVFGCGLFIFPVIIFTLYFLLI